MDAQSVSSDRLFVVIGSGWLAQQDATAQSPGLREGGCGTKNGKRAGDTLSAGHHNLSWQTELEIVDGRASGFGANQ